VITTNQHFRSYRSAIAPLLLLLVGAGVFANSLRGEFLFDDAAWIDDPAAISQFDSPTKWFLGGEEGPLLGRPLPAISIAANYAIRGTDVAGYHVFNIAIHLLCALVLFGVVRWTLQSEWFKDRLPASATGLAFCSALLWMIHPLQTECVNYISQRTESMAALFILLALYCAIRARQSARAVLWCAAAVAASWLAAMCKEIAVVIPALVLLYDFAFRAEKRWSPLRRRIGLYVGLCSCWIPVAALMLLAPRSETVGALNEVTWLFYLKNQCVVIPHYLQLAFWPQALTLDYGLPIAQSWSEVLPGAALVAGLFVGTVASLIYRPKFGFLGVWFFIILAPTSSFIPIVTEVGAERRMYLPSMAVVVFAVVLGAVVLRSVANRMLSSRNLSPHGEESGPHGRLATVGALVVAVVALPLAWRTVDRNSDYREPLTLWWSSLQQRPKNARAALNVAVLCEAKQMHDEATLAYEVVVNLNLKHPLANRNLAALYQRACRYADAIRHYRIAIEAEPNWAAATQRLAWLLATCEDVRFRDGTEAQRLLRAICSDHPEHPVLLDSLAAAHAECAEFEKAVAVASRAKDLARRGKMTALADAINTRLALYKQRRPYRQVAAKAQLRSEF
jgi:hypothetical protein